MKTTFIDEKNYTASIERYIKDDVSKLVMEKNNSKLKEFQNNRNNITRKKKNVY